MAELPYDAEYAISGRASCKACKVKIDKGVLRIAAMVQSAFYDGKQANWYHEECFFKKQRPKSADEIGRLNALRNADQKRIREAIISTSSGLVMPVEKGKKGKASKRAAESSSGALRDFAVEYSKSSRATCRVCEIKICKDEVRISKTVFDTEVGQKFGGQPLWHHVKCFAEARNDLLYLASGEDLPGFNSLKKEDKAMVKKEIPALKGNDIPVKKLKEEPIDIDQEIALDKKIDKQNNQYFKYRDLLSHYSKKKLHEILQANSQDTPPGIEECLNRVADIMTFGALKPCSECKQGQYVLDTYGYKCTGNISEWSKCQNVTQKPERVAFIVPAAYKKEPEFKKFKPKVSVRLFKSAPKPQFIVVKKEDTVDGIKKERPIPPLKHLQFFIYGKVKTPKEELKKRILKLGGSVASKLHDEIAAVISTKKDVDRMPNKMEEIKEKDIEVVEETYLDSIDSKGTISDSLQLIKVNNIAEWGSDPLKRIPQDVIDGKSIPKSGSIYVKSEKSALTKLKVKGGIAVDPDSGLEDVAHVYKDSDAKYTVVLGQTDVVAQKNSYYKMQILESDNKNKYWLFKSWGRIGTKIGGSKVDEFPHVCDAIEKFEEIYFDKTANPWESRDTFTKIAGRYIPIEVDYDDEDQKTVALTTDKNCKLPIPVQALIIKIFDIDVMKRTLKEFELDTEKMPLGKLSKKQIKAGYKVLSELLQHIEKDSASQNKIIDATNSFYTLIPHNFGISNPPLLDNVEAIKTKTDMIDNLLEIEIAYSLLNTGTNEETTDSPVERHYLKLKTQIVPLDKDSSEYELLMKYVKNTHAATHSQYTLDVEQIFKVVRDGEDKRYKPFKKLHNRRLLWHGSRITNFAGILSQGLRIAPPEAPSTGYMFGKGIYFADMVSKSANYCATSNTNPVGVMLLCEVALGEMKECTQSEHVTKLPSGKHSVWGKGRTMPNPDEDHVLECGTIVPLGKPIEKKLNTSLLYNEFIVYDVAQVNVKYLFQMKFNYKY